MKGAHIKLKGALGFRQRLICSTLSGKAISISEIRSDDEEPGMKDYEVSFVRLISQVTNGCEVAISETGTQINYRPGQIQGANIEFECKGRSIGYFLEGLIYLLPFAKEKSRIVLKGITNEDRDMSVDTLRTVTLPLLEKFGINEGLSLKIKKRGAVPLGGGEVVFKCPVVKALTPCSITDPGQVKRIRGISYCTRVSPQLVNRVVDDAKDRLTKFTPNVFLYTDPSKGKSGGNSSPGYALFLVAETTTNCLLSVEATGKAQQLPEILANKVCDMLLKEIEGAGCFDSSHQAMILLFMALCPEDVSKVRLSAPTEYAMEMMRNIKRFLGVTFKIQEHRAIDEDDGLAGTVVFSCLGSGFKNLSKAIS